MNTTPQHHWFLSDGIAERQGRGLLRARCGCVFCQGAQVAFVWARAEEKSKRPRRHLLSRGGARGEALRGAGVGLGLWERFFVAG